MRVYSILALALSLVAARGAFGQEKPTIEKIVDLHLSHASGPVPVYYSSGFEARALKYQKAVIACQQWYNQQVRKHVDITLAVLNKEDWEKVTDVPYPMPANVGGWRSLPPAGLLVPARFEDYPNSADFADNAELLVQNIAFHELGHLYVHYNGMEIDDNLLAELYANIFMAAYVRAQRPDMIPFLQGPSPKLPPERYTSLEDVQYLGADVGFTNYGWFQFQIYRMGDLLLRDKPLRKLLAELKRTFNDPVQRPFKEVATKLEFVHPGIAKEMGDLWNRTTIPYATPKRCAEAGNSDKDSEVVVMNLSAKPVKIRSGNNTSVMVAPNSWYTLEGHSAILYMPILACASFLEMHPRLPTYRRNS